MSKEQSPPPQGYGHDAKGAAGGKNVPDGGVTVSHSEPVGTVGGKGSGPQIIKFELDGQQVEARVGETIWQVAKRQGREIPHLCYSPEPDYRPDGNCRACMVEIEGERVLGGLVQADAERRHESEICERPRRRRAEDGDGASGRRPAGT